MSTPEWALPLIERIRNAIIEKPGDVDCKEVLLAVLDGQGSIDLPAGFEFGAGTDLEIKGDIPVFIKSITLGRQPSESIYRAINCALAKELRGAA